MLFLFPSIRQTFPLRSLVGIGENCVALSASMLPFPQGPFSTPRSSVLFECDGEEEGGPGVAYAVEEVVHILRLPHT